MEQKEREKQMSVSENLLSSVFGEGYLANNENIADNYVHLCAQYQKLKEFMENLLRSYEDLMTKNQLLKSQLAKYNRHSQFSKSSPSLDFGLNFLQGQKAQTDKSIVERVNQPKVSLSSLKPKKTPSEEPRKTRDISFKKNFDIETNQISDFVRNHLSKYIIFDKNKENKVPKKIIRNLYLRWCKLKNRIPQIKDILVNMQLTNELKSSYPEINHNGKVYIGLMFQSDLVKFENSEVGQTARTKNKLETLRTSKVDQYKLKEEQDYEQARFPLERMSFDDFELDSIKFQAQYDQFESFQNDVDFS